MMKTFQDLLLNPQILRAIEESGYTHPTPIQLEAIPHILAKRDVQGSAQTGTGKTAAFILPILERLAEPRKRPIGPKALILVPTRELAMQIAHETAKYGQHLPKLKTVCIYGGAPYPAQNRELSKPYEILIATPGRLIDHLERKRISFAQLDYLILDEADRMLDMGFLEPVQRIAEQTPVSRQTLMFSATFSRSVLQLAKALLKNPVEIAIAAEQRTLHTIEQRLYPVDDLDHKYQMLDHFLIDAALEQTIVFTATKRQADTLVEVLLEKGHSADALHGDMHQRERSRTMNKLRKGQIRILVATDVAARGIDVQTITHVINFDLPNNGEDYVHRIGRTGRAGKAGIALSMASPRDRHLVKDIERFTGQALKATTIAGLEPKAKPPAPKKKRFPRRKFRKT